MKIWILVLVFVVLGVAAGLGSTAIEMSRHGDESLSVTPGKLGSGQSHAVAVVDDDDFDFGSMQQGSKMSHVFTIRNEGTSPLTLGKMQTTCKCTLGDLAASAIPPGQSTTATLEWKADTGEGEFRQQATLQTNDPSRPTLTLTVHGTVTFTHQVRPDKIIFDGVSANTGGTSSAKIVSWMDEELKISSHEFDKREYSDYFSVELKPLSPSDLTEGEKSGFEIVVAAESGLPLEPIHQLLRLNTNLTNKSVVEIPIEGDVRGDITVTGTNFNAVTNTLTLGTISGAKGASAELTLFVRGPHRDKVEFRQISSVPAEVRAQIGEPVNRNTVTTVSIRLEVPPGTPQGNYLGSLQGELGEITLSTGHPDTKELKIRLRMLIEG